MKTGLFISFLLFISFITQPAVAQFDYKSSYKFYGFVRAEGFYNTRNNVDACDGLQYMYPKPRVYDANGKDINSTSDAGFISYITRLGLNVKGPDVGSAKLTGKIETDFGGNSGGSSTLRIRLAYLKLDWERGSSLLLGQAWHPLWGDFYPQVADVSSGAPFQFLNRSPMLQYTYTNKKFRLKASAVYQAMTKSDGPNGQSNEYMRRSKVPEMVVGVDYIGDRFNVGANLEFLYLSPRNENSAGNKVNEHVSSFSYEVHAKYTKDLFSLALKSALSSNMGHCAVLGGYGVHSENAAGKYEYTTFRHSSTWINATYGKKYQLSAFAGYTKNLGSDKSLMNTQTLYGQGLDIDQLVKGSLVGSYNLPYWKVALEYTVSSAWYGNIEASSGKVRDSHSATNHRASCIVVYYF